MATVTMDRMAFQALHSAARALYKQALESEDHSPNTLLYLTALDAAIDAGHEALGTHRPSADKYIHVIGGITKAQAQNAQAILRNEGLLDDE